MYVPDIQQGNVIEQEMINRLKPGMSKNQVSYVMGTPMLIDVFHQDRWDFIYSLKKGKGKRTQKRTSLYFEDDRLVRIEGDFRPGVVDEAREAREAAIFEVPDNPGDRPGIFSRALNAVGLENE